MADPNFQQFLKVLEDIEIKDLEEDTNTADGFTPCSRQNGCAAESSSEKVTLPPIGRGSKVGKLKNGVLRQPGFVYRTKNRAEGTYLDNNLWEYTCRRRMLKSPSFKYRYKRKSELSPYSSRILDSLTGLSIRKDKCQNIAASSTQRPPNWPRKAATRNATCVGNKPQLITQNKFVPLSTNANFIPSSAMAISANSRLKHHPIQPGKLKLLHRNIIPRIEKNCEQPLQKNGVSLWSTDGLCTSFGEVPESLKSGGFENAPWNENPHIKTSDRAFSKFRTNGGDNVKRKTSEPRRLEKSCSYQARMSEHEVSVDEVSSYMEDFLVLPQKMSSMAEMMYL